MKPVAPSLSVTVSRKVSTDVASSSGVVKLALAEKADTAEVPDGVSLPDELKRREDRLAAMATAKAKLVERADARYKQEKAEYDEKTVKRTERAARAAETDATVVAEYGDASP